MGNAYQKNYVLVRIPASEAVVFSLNFVFSLVTDRAYPLPFVKVRNGIDIDSSSAQPSPK